LLAILPRQHEPSCSIQAVGSPCAAGSLSYPMPQRPRAWSILVKKNEVNGIAQPQKPTHDCSGHNALQPQGLCCKKVFRVPVFFITISSSLSFTCSRTT
jgi:hypothetical protein